MANPDGGTPTYWDYLRLDDLLSLQGGLESDEQDVCADELHFIVVHQVFELWFKLVLREVRLARDHLAMPVMPEEAVPRVVHHMGRVTSIFDLGVRQWRVMETLTPQDFLRFRDKLFPASGFQSWQMRELELLLGLAEAEPDTYGRMAALQHIETLAEDSPGGRTARQALEDVRKETTLRGALHEWLQRTPIQGSRPGDADDDDTVRRFLESYLEATAAHVEQQIADMPASVGGGGDEMRERFDKTLAETRRFLMADDVAEDDRAARRRLRAALVFIESYRDLPLLAWPRLLLDAVVELEEQIVLWRTHHARMVERMIGRRVGTGGSCGVDYLDQTTRYRVFKELWAVRTLLLPADRLPPLENPEFYGFAADDAAG